MAKFARWCAVLTIVFGFGIPVIQTTATEPANAAFRQMWQRADQPVADGIASRTWMWGPEAMTGALSEPYAESPGGERTVQYFDKARMEMTNPDVDPTSTWSVTSGLLVVELVTGQLQLGENTFVQRLPAQINVAGDEGGTPGTGVGPTYATFNALRTATALAPDTTITWRLDHAGQVSDDPELARYGVTAAERIQVPRIDHTIAAPFWSFMHTRGTVFSEGGYVEDMLFENPFSATGYPITEAYWATVRIAGEPQDVLLQCFERRCLTYTPSNPPGWQVEAGNVGRHYYQWRYPGQQSSIELAVEPVVSGLDQPVLVTHAGDGSRRLFVVEKPGRIQIIVDGQVTKGPFLDISDNVYSEGFESGMLGLAFHPEFEENGYFYVTYSPTKSSWTLVRYQVVDDGSRADPESATTLLTLPEVGYRHFGGHYAGMLAFGPDGYLYATVGDGGVGPDGQERDPDNHAQDLGTLLGKLLRIDVNGGAAYAIPPDNPFVDTPGARPEIWAYGLRNPWRFSFDRQTGDLYIGDVAYLGPEELDIQPAGSRGGQNYGWPLTEGGVCTPSHPGCDPSAFAPPALTFLEEGCAVIGGYVYRGDADAAGFGAYIFGDYCTGTIWAADLRAGRPDLVVTSLATTLQISSFGEDEAGEIYVTDVTGGTVQRLTVGAHD